jgi:hypothetical protein
MTDRELVAYRNTRTCLHLDTRKDPGTYWTTTMAKELQIVLDYVKEEHNSAE